jgi:hypothetical protein
VHPPGTPEIGIWFINEVPLIAKSTREDQTHKGRLHTRSLRPRVPREAGKGGGEARGDSVRQVSRAVRERAGREPIF